VADAVSRGLNIYQTPSRPRLNGIFVGILHYHNDSGSILSQMHYWIDMLELAGVSTDEHVRIETEFCFTTWQENPSMSNYRRVLTIMESRGRRLPCWVQIAGNECPVRHLLNEFQHFMTPLTFFNRYITTGKCLKQYEAWKKGQVWDFEDEREKLSDGWPFWFPLQRYRSSIYENREEDNDRVNHQMRLMQSRFERRQNRKWRKAGRKESFWKPRPMPGGWEEEACMQSSSLSL
jgi:hypothetical protein